jgi:hypothetical protein
METASHVQFRSLAVPLILTIRLLTPHTVSDSPGSLNAVTFPPGFRVGHDVPRLRAWCVFHSPASSSKARVSSRSNPQQPQPLAIMQRASGQKANRHSGQRLPSIAPGMHLSRPVGPRILNSDHDSGTANVPATNDPEVRVEQINMAPSFSMPPRQTTSHGGDIDSSLPSVSGVHLDRMSMTATARATPPSIFGPHNLLSSGDTSGNQALAPPPMVSIRPLNILIVD